MRPDWPWSAAVEPRFEATEQNGAQVAEIVARLEGLPLAIELAASQMGRTGPLELLTQLRTAGPRLESPFSDSDPRHASLQAAIEGSWHLLSPVAQRVLCHLTVFHGPFTEEAAVAVVDPGPEGSVSEALGALREASLLRLLPEADPTGARRWDAFVAIRQFAAGRLDSADRAPLRERHALHWLAWGERWVERLQTERGIEARRLLSQHLGELHASFEWLSGHRSNDEKLRSEERASAADLVVDADAILAR